MSFKCTAFIQVLRFVTFRNRARACTFVQRLTVNIKGIIPGPSFSIYVGHIIVYFGDIYVWDKSDENMRSIAFCLLVLYRAVKCITQESVALQR